VKPTRRELSSLHIAVFYEGPWEHLATWLAGIDRKTMNLRFILRPGGVREKLYLWAEDRNTAWRNRWVRRRRDPPAIWKRRP
jgi:hypothetical protein